MMPLTISGVSIWWNTVEITFGTKWAQLDNKKLKKIDKSIYLTQNIDLFEYSSLNLSTLSSMNRITYCHFFL